MMPLGFPLVGGQSAHIPMNDLLTKSIQTRTRISPTDSKNVACCVNFDLFGGWNFKPWSR
ncbi:hypothetical protein DUNSADRAFT_15252 [Dunaliella salina]|uniref:Encoded protein n=1 Tax=Dunaliella salina TaxID=3046 RepID=A0ABQ7H1Z7_DUNSA|nr:hypothetical protein DUNSADRAFT_15252 [Dunaliella salina]|eukprot:KAF5840884.1 hypothetical protein DUNSADRAFT_15252 [Dunaliella salina]